ncbi:hypothetical protein [Beijerinckia sp. L45]|uniref:hypothetical protein n=1 Tax=Beijerinckia sp. L45 TaxID=1641855 RepID=UPI00131D6435|nr:hypothetical protein [Beijerinckia sp. L45]
MLWPVPLRHWFGEAPQARTTTIDDVVGDRLRAVVSEHTRVKADAIRCYEARVQSMIGELFARMGESHARHDP